MADSLHGGPSAPQAGMDTDGAGGCACFLGCPFRQEPSKTGANSWGVNAFQITCVLQPNRLSAQFETMWRLRPLTLFPGRCKRGSWAGRKACCAMAAAWVGPSRRTSKTFLASTVAARIVKISKPTSSTRCPNAGLSRAVLPGWRRSGGCAKNCERLPHTCLQFIRIAFLALLCRIQKGSGEHLLFFQKRSSARLSFCV